MAVSIGINYAQGQWRICCIEQGQVTELHLFESEEDMLVTARQLCLHYPEPTIVVSLERAMPFVALVTLSEEQLERLIQRSHPVSAHIQVKKALQGLSALNLRSYCAPSVEYLPTVPLHRRLMRPALGTASDVCAVVALLHYMREQQAAWSEMNFLCINAGENGTSVLAIIDGQIINGINPLPGSVLFEASASSLSPATSAVGIDLENEKETRQDILQSAADEAFWEGLTQELAGLLAIHHIEDLVILGQRSAKLIERLAENQQVYLFPHAHTEREGYEAALGAALLGEGLEGAGSAAEVIDHLQIRQADRT